MKVRPQRQRTSRKTKALRVIFLLDNDRVAADLRRYLEREIGHACQRQYFYSRIIWPQN
jgi:5S rRNA maturation endonuclease (ribonuclease M5)